MCDLVIGHEQVSSVREKTVQRRGSFISLYLFLFCVQCEFVRVLEEPWVFENRDDIVIIHDQPASLLSQKASEWKDWSVCAQGCREGYRIASSLVLQQIVKGNRIHDVQLSRLNEPVCSCRLPVEMVYAPECVYGATLKSASA